MRESVQLSIEEKNEIYKFAVAYFSPYSSDKKRRDVSI